MRRAMAGEYTHSEEDQDCTVRGTENGDSYPLQVGNEGASKWKTLGHALDRKTTFEIHSLHQKRQRRQPRSSTAGGHIGR